MLFRRFAITSALASIALFACGNKIPVESPAGAGSTESASQASKASTDEISAKLENGSSGKSGFGRHGGRRLSIDALRDSLGLSDEQVSALEELNESYAADVKAAIERAKASGDRTGLRAKLRELREEYEDDFNEVLTDEQQARLEEIGANAAARRKDRGWENIIATLADSLDLSDEQVADLNELYEDYQADVKAAIDSAQESDDRSGLKEKLQELREGFGEDFSAVLTDEQKEKLDEMKSEGRKRKGKGRRHGHKGRKG